MNYTHGIELIVYLGVGIALVAFAVLVVTTVEAVSGARIVFG